MVYSRESSPDPLIATPDASNTVASSPVRAGSAIQAFKPSRALRESSPNIRSPSPVKQQRTIIFSTPTKGSRRDPVAASSPWRIKVTVEAEPGSGEESGQKRRTTTIKVPLKGEDEHVPVKRKRTPRKSVEGAQVGAGSKAAAGRATPRKRKSAGAGDLAGENAAQADVADGADAENNAPQEPAKRPRGRPRKSLEPVTKLSTPTKPAARRNTRNLFADVTPLHQKEAFDVRANMPPAVEQEWIPDQKIANRVPTPARPAASRIHIPVVSSMAGQADGRSSLRGGSTVQTYDGNSEAEECAEESAGEDAELDVSGRTFSPSDETIALDRSLAESEGFTMVSLDSLRSRHDILVDHPDASTREPQTGSSPAQDQGETASGTLSPPQASVDAEDVIPVAEEEASLAPEEHYAHVSMSPREIAIGTPESPQELVEQPWDEPQQDAQPRSMAQKRKSGDSDMFHGFRTGTKRQLRANLAMGELLARNEPGFGALAASMESRKQTAEEQNAIRQTIARLPTPADTADMSSSPPVAASTIKKKQIASRSDLPLETETGNRSYDEMSWEPIQARQQYHEMGQISGLPVPLYSDDGEEGRREIPESPELSVDQPSLEMNPTKPIYDEASQDQDEGEDGPSSNTGGSNPRSRAGITSKRKRGEVLDITGDLWLGEANSSLEDSLASQASRARKVAKKPEEPPLDFKELFGEDDRPQRGKLPRTWRRESGNHFLYSDENPSPVRAVSKSFFERDLENLSELQDRELVVSTIERSPTPLRGILSSLHCRSVSRSPKAVSFGGDDVHEFESEVHPNEQYYSSEDSGSSSASDGDDDAPELLTAEDDMDATFFEQGMQDVRHAEGSSLLEASDVRQIRREMALPSQASTAPKAPSPDASSSCPAHGSSVLRPNPHKQYTRLFPTLTGSSVKHPARESVTTPRKPTPTAAQPTQGIFARLASWLYPPPPPQRTWNRNHFYVLEHHWKASFPTPQHVLADARATQSLPPTGSPPARAEDTDHDLAKEQAQLAHLPHDLSIYANVTLHIPPTHPPAPPSTTPPPLTLTPTHLHITHAFIREAADRGIPLLSDGCLTRRRPSADFPRRDARGRVLRVRELWQCWDVLCFLYGLWGRDVMAALEEVGSGEAL